ncbi:bifunctional folylpolyglutamate synthase/dihydrofolate synthase [Sphingomonas canadensis]|uniref:Dihydrofolate synthase/folylpolyglutamate synthase n=1 Tax=Sphingomonas canadensis TaxID=1219257 RepID=A0ABW3HBT8_9SPHN|nr:folylpolyglutamate synthase/dihydrofolate synthase family protein [Sphingomonas canadensis]MCW3837946.1 bifunctional folylpolyglutamate synthase/dihydrofolate synthase [Sphingomonas canadensis]
MPDFAISANPAVQQQLDRLNLLSPGADILGLERITRLLDRVGNPHLRLPPVFHVAGTNGKGSVCAYLRAGVEAAGLKAHVYTSPHLVRFNERIRLAGSLIADALLAELLAEVLDAGGDIGASFFEVTTAAAFLAFARTPADCAIVEVGLGGRLDATNVIADPAVTGIIQLGIDHQFFLGNTAEEIAGEKAGIAKPGVPLVTMRYPPSIAARVAEVAAERGAVLATLDDAWDYRIEGGMLIYRDARGSLGTPLPALPGPHQAGNLALAIALMRHNRSLPIPEAALAGAWNARWPARMQRMRPGPLHALLPDGAELWLDGGHNEAAAEAVATALARAAGGRRVHLVLGMLSNKDAQGLLTPLAPLAASLHAVPVPGHEHHAPTVLAEVAQALAIPHASPSAGVAEALREIAASTRHGEPPIVLILGSLYLAGRVLEANDELPD